MSFLEIKNSSNNTKAIISLDEGGRLKELKFDGISVIKDQMSQKYEDTFASSILFPFANRIKNGYYFFNDEEHQFNCNESGNKNALHGLVYNKKFEVIQQELHTNSGAVTLLYQEKEKSRGFPFFYDISIKYTLEEHKITVSVEINNTDKQSFPFTLGWHPYFVSTDLHNSFLHFNSVQKIQFDHNLITDKIIDFEEETPYQIKANQLDDCYILRDNSIELSTPLYRVVLDTNTKENYLQLYTPPNRQVIAIEPMTGISDSFNNKKGLQILQPNEDYEVRWNLSFSKTVSENE